MVFATIGELPDPNSLKAINFQFFSAADNLNPNEILLGIQPGGQMGLPADQIGGQNGNPFAFEEVSLNILFSNNFCYNPRKKRLSIE